MSTQPQPAPVLAWHREAAWKVNLIHTNGDWSETENPGALIAQVIAQHDPHAETVRLLELALNVAEGYQKCVRLLEEASGQYVNSAQFFQLDSNMKAASAHLAKLKGTP